MFHLTFLTLSAQLASKCIWKTAIPLRGREIRFTPKLKSFLFYEYSFNKDGASVDNYQLTLINYNMNNKFTYNVLEGLTNFLSKLTEYKWTRLLGYPVIWKIAAINDLYININIIFIHIFLSGFILKLQIIFFIDFKKVCPKVYNFFSSGSGYVDCNEKGWMQCSKLFFLNPVNSDFRLYHLKVSSKGLAKPRF